MERCNSCFGATDAVVHMMHQVAIKNIAKAEFLLGVILMMIETVAIEQFQHVQEKAAEVITYLETMKACLRAAEADAHLDSVGRDDARADAARRGPQHVPEDVPAHRRDHPDCSAPAA